MRTRKQEFAFEINPQRCYNEASKKILLTILERAIEAVKLGGVQDPGDVGLIANALRQFATVMEPMDDISNWFSDYTDSIGGPVLDYILRDGLLDELWEQY